MIDDSNVELASHLFVVRLYFYLKVKISKDWEVLPKEYLIFGSKIPVSLIGHLMAIAFPEGVGVIKVLVLQSHFVFPRLVDRQVYCSWVFLIEQLFQVFELLLYVESITNYYLTLAQFLWRLSLPFLHPTPYLHISLLFQAARLLNVFLNPRKRIGL